jgi:hypothetical protein
MIHRKLRPTGLCSTILACLAISSEHTPARTWQFQAPWYPNIANKPYNQRHIEREGSRSELLLGSFNQLGLFLQQQDHGTTHRNKLKRLIAGIENENALRQGNTPSKPLLVTNNGSGTGVGHTPG